jgi:hypothetical protein
VQTRTALSASGRAVLTKRGPSEVQHDQPSVVTRPADLAFPGRSPMARFGFRSGLGEMLVAVMARCSCRRRIVVSKEAGGRCGLYLV